VTRARPHHTPSPKNKPTKQPWYEAPFASRRNIALSMLGGSAAWLFYTKQVLPPVKIGEPPADFSFKLAGYTDIAPEEFVYAKTPGGNWIAAATDPEGRLFMIDEVRNAKTLGRRQEQGESKGNYITHHPQQNTLLNTKHPLLPPKRKIGDLYYDSGDPQIGLYALDTNGNLFNIYRDADGARRTTPVGNVSDLARFKISDVAGVKLDRDVTVVAFKDGRVLELPPGAGVPDGAGGLIAPREIVEGVDGGRGGDNPFARLLGRGGGSGSFPLDRPEVDPADPRPYERQLFDQVLLDDPDIPGYQPALPEGFDLEKFAREVAAESRRGGK
jgi:hypothetical protein